MDNRGAEIGDRKWIYGVLLTGWFIFIGSAPLISKGYLS